MRNIHHFIQLKQMKKQEKDIIIKNQVMLMEHKLIIVLIYQINLDNKNNHKL